MTPLEALIKNIFTLVLLGYLHKITKNYEGRNILVPAALFVITYIALLIAFPIKSYGTSFDEPENLPTVVEQSDTLPDFPTPIDTVVSVTRQLVHKGKPPIQETTSSAASIKKDTLTKSETTTKSAYTPKVSIYAGFKNFSDGVTANIDKGTSIVCMLSLECEHCMETARQIGEMNKEEKLPPVYFLFFGSQGQVEPFFDVAKYRFPFRLVEPQVFFPLLGDISSPPRVSVLKEGNIVADFDNDSFSKEKLKKAVE